MTAISFIWKLRSQKSTQLRFSNTTECLEHIYMTVRPSTIHPFVRRSKHALVFGDLNSLHDKDYNDGDNNNKIINKVCFVYFFAIPWGVCLGLWLTACLAS